MRNLRRFPRTVVTESRAAQPDVEHHVSGPSDDTLAEPAWGEFFADSWRGMGFCIQEASVRQAQRDGLRLSFHEPPVMFLTSVATTGTGRLGTRVFCMSLI
jgi:hypothetical protein